MTGSRFLPTAGLAGLMALSTFAGFGPAPVAAQSMRDVETPAEFPPASYEGKQYVDSRGCVYVRAGVDGNVTWVPRVTRSREAVCGFAPTLGAGSETRTAEAAPTGTHIEITPEPATAQAKPAATATRVPTPTPAPAPTPAPRATAKATTAAPRPAPRSAEPGPAPMATVASTPARAAPARSPAASEPRIVKAPVRRVVVAPDARIAASAGAGIASYGRCADGSPVTGIRCGAGAGATYVSRGNSGLRHRDAASATAVPRTRLVEAAPGSVSGEATIVPRHVYTPPEPASARISVPAGYRPAWDDDRLNERRAYQTLNGKAEMELIWTRTVPRRLVDRLSGEDMTTEYPRLFYPFTDYATQQAYLSSRGDVRVLVGKESGRVRLERRDDPVISTRSAAPAPKAKAASVASTAAAAPRAKAAPMARKARVATAADPARKVPQAEGRLYIQVGAFGVAANAQGSLRRLQGAGLPATARPMRSGGKVLQVVMAGPFASTGAARAALGKVRGAGFGHAFIR